MVEANTNNTVLYASVGGVAGIVIAAVLVVILLAAVAYARYCAIPHCPLYLFPI